MYLALKARIGYRGYLLGVLLLALSFTYVDRLALGLVLQNIKTDLHLSDTQLGLLTGIAFALFYSVLGIPIARWADRGNRVTILVVTTALGSCMLALCGLAQNFLQLLLIRIGLAVGEAGCMPTATSLITEHFKRSERPRAMAIFMLGAPVSLVIGAMGAGWLNENYGWRITFIILGIPGLALAAMMSFTLKESRRQEADASERAASRKSAPDDRPSLLVVAWALWTNITFRHLLLALVLGTLAGYGTSQWTSIYLIRTFGIGTAELGAWATLIYGVGGLIAGYGGGWLATRYASNNERLQLAACAAVFVGFALVNVGLYLAPTKYFAFCFMGAAAIGNAITHGPIYALIPSLVPEWARATAIALIYLIANLIGMGLGPLAIGMLSDGLRPLLGEASLRYALVAVCPVYAWAGWHLWHARKTVAQDLQLAQAGTERVHLKRGSRLDKSGDKHVIFD